MLTRLFVLGVALISSSVAYCAPKTLDKIVASVNDRIITKSQLNNYKGMILAQLPSDTVVPPDHILEKQVLDKVIMNTALLDLAEANGIIVDAESVDKSIDFVAKQRGISIAELKRQVDASGIDYQQYRRNMQDELIISKLQQQEVLPRLSVSEQEVDNYLDSPLGQEEMGAQYKLSHILIQAPDNMTNIELDKVRSKASKIVDELKKGADFSSVALRESSGQNSLQGGDLGWREISKIPTIFAQEVANMKVGSVAGPIQSSSGFHVIKLMDKKISTEGVQDISEYKTMHILVKPGDKVSNDQAQKLLQKAVQDIKSGKKSFDDVARKISNEPVSASKGGDLGWISSNSVIPDFYKQVTKAKIGAISEPFRTALGWHVIEVVEKRNTTNSRELARKQALMSLREQKYAEMVEIWAMQVRENAQVKLF